ncbi:MAG: VOC family protein [Nocardioidaceae bacterium]|nr:VOC family protein [Nocardioidaceae bacterium]
MIQGFSHVGVAVSDLERSVAFYTAVLGFTVLYRMDFANDEVAVTMEQEGAFRSAMLVRGDIRVELLQWEDVPITGGGRRPMTELGFTHLSFRVDDIGELDEAVAAYGGEVVAHTRQVLGDPGDPAAPRLVYLTDPDGTRIELMQNVPDLRAPTD